MALQTLTKIVGKQIPGSLRYQAWQVTAVVSNDYLIPLKASLWKDSSKGYLTTNAALNIQLNVDESSPSGSPMDVIAIPANGSFVWEDGISVRNIYIPAGQSAIVNIYAE